jgi:hypothetical protein
MRHRLGARTGKGARKYLPSGRGRVSERAASMVAVAPARAKGGDGLRLFRGTWVGSFHLPLSARPTCPWASLGELESDCGAALARTERKAWVPAGGEAGGHLPPPTRPPTRMITANCKASTRRRKSREPCPGWGRFSVWRAWSGSQGAPADKEAAGRPRDACALAHEQPPYQCRMVPTGRLCLGILCDPGVAYIDLRLASYQGQYEIEAGARIGTCLPIRCAAGSEAPVASLLAVAPWALIASCGQGCCFGRRGSARRCAANPGAGGSWRVTFPTVARQQASSRAGNADAGTTFDSATSPPCDGALM